jgi:hypothetical protein
MYAATLPNIVSNVSRNCCGRAANAAMAGDVMTASPNPDKQKTSTFFGLPCKINFRLTRFTRGFQAADYRLAMTSRRR